MTKLLRSRKCLVSIPIWRDTCVSFSLLFIFNIPQTTPLGTRELLLMGVEYNVAANFVYSYTFLIILSCSIWVRKNNIMRPNAHTFVNDNVNDDDGGNDNDIVRIVVAISLPVSQYLLTTTKKLICDEF